MYRSKSSFTQVLVAALLGSSVVHAAPPLVSGQSFTLEGAVQSAFEHSPELQKMEAKYQEAKWQNVEGFSAFLPIVSVSATHFFETKYQLLDVPFGGKPVEIPQIFPSSSAGLSAKWILFDGLANINTFNASTLVKTAGEKEYLWAKFELERKVSLAYAKVVAAKKLDDVAEENLKTLDDHLKQVKALHSGGVATNYDVLRVESQFSEAQTELLQAQDNIEISRDQLGQALGLSEAADSKDDAELTVPNAEKIKVLTFNKEGNQRLDLAALDARVHASDLIEAAKSKFWVPKIGLTADYTKYNNLTDTLSDWDHYRNSWDVGFFLSWDIFNPREFAQSKEEAYRTIQAEKSLVSAHLQAPIDFTFWKKRYIYSTSLYEAKKVDLERATETVRLAQAGFKAGVRTTTDVLDSELDLFRARAGIVNAQINAIEAKVKLELALGESL